MARKDRYLCRRNVEIDGKFYKGGMEYEFKGGPPVDKYFYKDLDKVKKGKKPKQKSKKKAENMED